MRKARLNLSVSLDTAEMLDRLVRVWPGSKGQVVDEAIRQLFDAEYAARRQQFTEKN